MKSNKFKSLIIALTLSFGLSGCAIFGVTNSFCTGIGISEDDPAYQACDVISFLILIGAGGLAINELGSDGGGTPTTDVMAGG